MVAPGKESIETNGGIGEQAGLLVVVQYCSPVYRLVVNDRC
jgi:hypothetical protein